MYRFCTFMIYDVEPTLGIGGLKIWWIGFKISKQDDRT
jgi:hypothetical protein